MTSRVACALMFTLALAIVGCERERRPVGANELKSPDDYEHNAYAVSQGKNLYRNFNCAGCHGPSGGGNMGPPLMDGKWRYGSGPQELFASIMGGRPNGMPAFSGKITEDQAWQLVAYVRSLSGQLRSDVAPSRNDALQGAEAEQRRPKMEPTVEKVDVPELKR